MVTVRREWRGVADTAYDFKEWLRTWGMLLGTFSKDLVPALNMTFYYRWMISYVCCVSFMDKNTMGQRSNALKMSHLLIYDIFRYGGREPGVPGQVRQEERQQRRAEQEGGPVRRDDHGPDHGGASRICWASPIS